MMITLARALLGAMVTAMKKQKTLSELWLWLGVSALAVAGLYSLVPVIGRTPQLKSLPVMQQFFDVALVVHVDLSVLIWFLSMLGMGAALVMEKHAQNWPFWLKSGWAMTALSALLMVLSPLGAWIPVKSNYIPMLHNLWFMFALATLAAGMLLTFIPLVMTHLAKRLQADAIGRGWAAGGLVVLLALVGFTLSARNLPAGLTLVEHYETLFWAGGHVLQFSFTLLVMAAWLALLAALGATLPSARGVNMAYGLALLGALASLAGFAIHAPDTGDFTFYQTRIMIEVGGLGVSLMALLVVAKLIQTKLMRATRTYVATLVVSLILFFAGGALGLMISGQNVTIPAHYHGMIVGITVALMGLAYSMLPRFGYASVASNRLAFWQPIVYGVGQMMHIGGLAYCGGYGILRKTAGGFENIAPDVKIALGIFGLGGLLAIIGGILFVVVVVRAVLKPSVSLQPPML